MRSRLCLSWGVYPLRTDFVNDTDAMIGKIDAILRDAELVQMGDNLVFLAGMPPTQQGTTNLLRLHRVGTTLT